MWQILQVVTDTQKFLLLTNHYYKIWMENNLWKSFPANISLFKVKTVAKGVFTVNFKHISYLFLLLTLNKKMLAELWKRNAHYKFYMIFVFVDHKSIL